MRAFRLTRAVVALFILTWVVARAAAPIPPANGGSGSNDSFGENYHKLDPVLRGLVLSSPDHWDAFAAVTPILRLRNGNAVSVFMDGSVSDAEIRQLGGEVRVRMRSGIVSATLPIASLRALAELTSLTRAEVAARRHTRLDKAVPDTLSDPTYVRQTRGLTGKGVFVCVIDSGLDVRHPSFLNADGTTRVYAYRDPEADAEYNSQQINANPGAAPTDPDGHGTHVTGIAAGTGRSATGATGFVGVAPESGLLIAKQGASDQHLVDNIVWFNQKLDEIGAQTGARPRAVVNMSLGGHLGPHDGTNLLDRMLDEFIDAGLPMAISAGNEYDSGLHTSGTLSVGQTATLTILPPTGPDAPTSGNLTVDVWYQANDAMDFALLYQGQPVNFPDVGTTVALGTWAESQQGDGYIYVDHIDGGKNGNEGGPDSFSGDERGGRRVYVTVTWDDTNFHPKDLRLRLTGKTVAGSGEWHAWIVTENGTKWLNPDPRFTIGSPGSAKKAVTVASYVSRVTSSSEAPLGAISVFSSAGPLRNQLPSFAKPTIAAPGDVVVSAKAAGAKDDGDPVPAPNDYYGLQGTSMSSPMVAGAIALLLQANPKLTPAEIMSAIQMSAVASGDGERWGAGKLNLAAALKRLDPVTTQPALFVSALPAGGAIQSGSTITVTFDKDPGVLTVGGGTAVGTGVTRTITVSAATVTITWEGGATTLTYVIAPASNPSDVDENGVVNIIDVILVARDFGSASPITARADVNRDGIVSIIDVILVAQRFGAAAAPSANDTPARLLERLIVTARASDDGSVAFRDGIASLENILFRLVPTRTALLPNYPNPFNPETWIPFELRDGSDVSVSIYDAGGSIVRQFALGFKEPGM
ncbi:MAG: S8 family serine peptidase, partial [Candidatus Poribacteria bacterium]|nr:S8 family serine peptidase [Candidatus Poribacteria bacterium]